IQCTKYIRLKPAQGRNTPRNQAFLKFPEVHFAECHIISQIPGAVFIRRSDRRPVPAVIQSVPSLYYGFPDLHHFFKPCPTSCPRTPAPSWRPRTVGGAAAAAPAAARMPAESPPAAGGPHLTSVPSGATGSAVPGGAGPPASGPAWPAPAAAAAGASAVAVPV